MKKILFKNRGFTLVEIMVSMVIVSLVVAGIYAVYTIQQRTYTVQEQVTEMQQKIRAALDFMSRDIRMANFNPEGACSGIQGIIDIASQNFSFDYCDLHDGNWETHRVIYSFNNGNLVRDLARGTSAGVARNLAEGVDALEFLYRDADGDDAQTTNDIRSVRISMLVRSTFPDPRHTDTILYTPASGDTAWLDPNPPNNNFHRRLLITTVQLRNMGGQ
jgi:type IV pilus assembly protein PilW